MDAGELLAAGEQPVGQALADLSSLPAGSIFLVTAPFLPAPLIDKATTLGLVPWMDRLSDESFLIYSHRPSA